MKLIVCYGYYGHVELAPEDTVKTGKFAGFTQRQMFEQIMKEGYGNNITAHQGGNKGNSHHAITGVIPAVFHAEYQGGEVRMFKGSDAAGLIDDPAVKEVTVIAPIAGGNRTILVRPLPSYAKRGTRGVISEPTRVQRP